MCTVLAAYIYMYIDIYIVDVYCLGMLAKWYARELFQCRHIA